MATVLVVDDDPGTLMTYCQNLEEAGYDTLQAIDGQNALDLVQQQAENIDIILSDIQMPHMDGYQLCEKLKDDFSTADIPLIFVSGLSDLQEKMKGYSVGASDYITKPLHSHELKIKIDHLLETKQENNKLNQQVSDSVSTAMQAMNYSSGLGQVLAFYNNSLNAKTFEELSINVFEMTQVHGLKCSLYISTLDNTYTFGDQNTVSPLEKNIIELARKQGRFFDFKNRTVINYQQFSLLIKNMPYHDLERYGMIKDLLGTLCNAIESCINSLLRDNALAQKDDLIITVMNAMENIEKTFKNIQKDNRQAIESLTEDLEETMMTLGLTEPQENNIRQIAENCLERTNEIFYQSIVINDEFEKVTDQLASEMNKTES